MAPVLKTLRMGFISLTIDSRVTELVQFTILQMSFKKDPYRSTITGRADTVAISTGVKQ
jgi:hypothetical protein